MTMKVFETKASTALGKSSMKELKYAFNPYIGCFHGCKYCYAMDYTSKQDAIDRWGEVIYARTNILEILKMEIIKKPRGIVGMSTITDPYQPSEMKYHLSGRGAEILLNSGFHVSIQTKSPLILKDIGIYERFPSDVDIGITLNSLRLSTSRVIEPNAPSPKSRISALKEISGKVKDVWIYLGPLMHGINDDKDEIRDVLDFAEEIGVRIIYDFYSSYRYSDKMLGEIMKLCEGNSKVLIDPNWINEMEDFFRKVRREYKIDIISQKSEWLYERIKYYGNIT
ncbi:radical SAM protein [Caldiplasma sukawensis]